MHKYATTWWLIAAMLLLSTGSQAQTVTILDPGPRSGSGSVGGPLPGLNGLEMAFFNAAKLRFQEIDSVSGTIAGEDGSGLGPRFNGNSCAMCHAQPTVGGTSPATNPQVALANLHGATNVIPFFVTKDGPVREPRFLQRPDGTPDGSVHQVFVITNRIDANGCNTPQPDFSTASIASNLALRIPTPLFGLGLVEAATDIELQASFDAGASQRAQLGISGHFNHSGNDSTITRFGWKAQNPSALLFAGEAYNVEQGVSNEVFPHEVNDVPGCENPLGTPEDITNLGNKFNSGSLASDYASDVANFAEFIRLSAPPIPDALTAQTMQGEQIFTRIGCAACHTAALSTGMSNAAPSVNNVTFNPYSDFAVHGMGSGLADGVTQGSALGNEFRTAPLWGIGQRLFFLHDGRASDLDTAIAAHFSPGSEANTVEQRYARLPEPAKLMVLQFLRSL